MRKNKFGGYKGKMIKVILLQIIIGLLLIEYTQAEPSIDYIKNHAINFQGLDQLPDEVYTLVKPYKIITIGEIHGNNETPEFLYKLVNLLSQNVKRIAVGLELPTTSQFTVNQFMKTGDIDLLKKLEFFKRKLQDGRSSKAIAKLLSNLREINNLDIVCFDPTDYSNGQDRDSKMAMNLISSYKKHQPDILIILAGNIHSSISIGTSWDLKYRPMAYELFTPPNGTFSRNDILAIKSRYSGGTSWYCSAIECKIYKLNSLDSNYSMAINSTDYFLLERKIEMGYNATIYNQYLSASMPLIAK